MVCVGWVLGGASFLGGASVAVVFGVWAGGRRCLVLVLRVFLVRLLAAGVVGGRWGLWAGAVWVGCWLIVVVGWGSSRAWRRSVVFCLWVVALVVVPLGVIPLGVVLLWLVPLCRVLGAVFGGWWVAVFAGGWWRGLGRCVLLVGWAGLFFALRPFWCRCRGGGGCVFVWPLGLFGGLAVAGLVLWLVGVFRLVSGSAFLGCLGVF